MVTEAPGVFSIYITGRDLDQLAVRSGQYFVWRFLTRDGWWRAHPFSISSAPNGSWLRITVKELGDWSKALQGVSVGTRVFIEGPYGILTGARRTRRRVLLVAGGIGITPLRSLLEALPGRPGRPDPALSGQERARHRLPRGARRARQDPRSRGAVPPRPSTARAGTIDPLGPVGLQALVPDVRQRDVYICGPVPMMQHVEASLRTLGLPPRQIHAERFAY